MKDNNVYQIVYEAGDEDETTYVRGKDEVKKFIDKPEIECYMIWKNVTREFDKDPWGKEM